MCVRSCAAQASASIEGMVIDSGTDVGGVLAGRRALVIGVETVAGSAIARALAAAGVSLGLATMRADEAVMVARRLQREVQAAGGAATVYAFDVMLGQNVKVSTRQVAKELGGLDLLVSAVDRPLDAPLERTTDSELASTFIANCGAHLYAVRAALDEFRRAEGGRALLIVRDAGETGQPGAAAYAAAHGATLALVRSIGEELRGRGVGVDALIVGEHDAPEAIGAAALALLAAPPTAPVGRIVHVNEVQDVTL